MNSTDILKNSVILGLGLMVGNTTSSQEYPYKPSVIENTTSKKPHPSFLSATYSNNRDKFSLEQLRNNKIRLENFKYLNDNWNGYNGKRIPDNVIEKVTSIITQLDYQPQIFPTGRASLQIEEQLDDSTFYEIEIDSNSNYIYFSKKGNESEEENMELTEIPSLINSLYA